MNKSFYISEQFLLSIIFYNYFACMYAWELGVSCTIPVYAHEIWKMYIIDNWPVLAAWPFLCCVGRTGWGVRGMSNLEGRGGGGRMCVCHPLP